MAQAPFAGQPTTIPSLISRAGTVTTGTDGTAVWTYKTPFDAGVTPKVTASVEGRTSDRFGYHIVAGTNTNTSCKVFVWKTRTLPAVISLLGSLTGYDTTVAASGVVVNLLARLPD